MASPQSWHDTSWASSVPRELAESLDNLEHDDQKAPSLEEAVEEAKYITSLFHEGGTTSNEMLSGDHGPEGVKEAKKTLRDLARFIKKYGRGK